MDGWIEGGWMDDGALVSCVMCWALVLKTLKYTHARTKNKRVKVTEGKIESDRKEENVRMFIRKRGRGEGGGKDN